MVSQGGQGKAMCVLVWSGAAGRGMAWLGGSGMLGSGKLDYGMAVKLTNKWWAVVAHYTNIRNFLEDSVCLVLIRRLSSVS